MNHLKMIALAFHCFHDVHQKFPPVWTVNAEGKPLHSWRVLLLPFMEQTGLYEKIRLDEPWDSEWNRQFHSQIPDLYVCPSRPEDGGEEGITHYSVIVGQETIFHPVTEGNPDPKDLTFGGKNLADIKDGVSNTLLIVEQKKGVCWMDPTGDIPFSAIDNEEVTEIFSSPHPGGFNAARADGSVLFIPFDAPLEILKAMMTAAGRESKSL